MQESHVQKGRTRFSTSTVCDCVCCEVMQKVTADRIKISITVKRHIGTISLSHSMTKFKAAIASAQHSDDLLAPIKEAV